MYSVRFKFIKRARLWQFDANMVEHKFKGTNGTVEIYFECCRWAQLICCYHSVRFTYTNHTNSKNATKNCAKSQISLCKSPILYRSDYLISIIQKWKQPLRSSQSNLWLIVRTNFVMISSVFQRALTFGFHAREEYQQNAIKCVH